MEGLLNKEKEKFFAKLIAEEIPVAGIWQVTLKWTLPILVGAVDNNYGDKVPEPWKGYAVKLIDTVYLALQDGEFTEEEINEVIEVCAEVLNKEIDIPMLGEEEEAVVFIQLLKLIAALVKKGLK